MSGEAVRFVLVGGAGYAVNVAAFAGLHALGARYAAASVAAYLVANALMYVGNRRFTFRRGGGGFWRGYARYGAVGLVVAASTAVLLAVLVEVLGSDPRLGQAAALCAVTPVAFALNRRWTFA